MQLIPAYPLSLMIGSPPINTSHWAPKTYGWGLDFGCGTRSVKCENPVWRERPPAHLRTVPSSKREVWRDAAQPRWASSGCVLWDTRGYGSSRRCPGPALVLFLWPELPEMAAAAAGCVPWQSCKFCLNWSFPQGPRSPGHPTSYEICKRLFPTQLC